jgi:hypothetical protein
LVSQEQSDQDSGHGLTWRHPLQVLADELLQSFHGFARVGCDRSTVALPPVRTVLADLEAAVVQALHRHVLPGHRSSVLVPPVADDDLHDAKGSFLGFRRRAAAL